MHLNHLGSVTTLLSSPILNPLRVHSQSGWLQQLMARWPQYLLFADAAGDILHPQEESSRSSSACHVTSAHPGEPYRTLICPPICDWTSSLHVSFNIQNDPCSLTSTLFISVSVAPLCMCAFPGQKFQPHPSSFFHITLFLIQYQLPFCS